MVARSLAPDPLRASHALRARPAAAAPAAKPAQAAPAAVAAGGIQNKTLRLRLFEDLRIMDPSFVNTRTDTIVNKLVASKLLQHNINNGKIEPASPCGRGKNTLSRTSAPGR